jgi:hypothetical protein
MVQFIARRARHVVFGLLLVLPAGATRAADVTPAKETKLAPTPWHLVDLWWNTGAEQPFESYSIDATLSDDVPADVHLYVAPIGLGFLNKTQFYGGLQTRCDGNTRDDTHLREIGRGLIFSMWGERSLDAIRPSLGGFLQSSGHEGDFVSVRDPYAWTKGTYTYRLTRMDQQSVEGKPYTWVGAFVYSHERNENAFVGALRFPGEKLVLGKELASFIEIYGPQRPLSEIPRVTITFGNLTINGERLKNVSARAVYPQKVPDYAEAVGKDQSVVVTVGQPVANRTRRRADLFSAKPLSNP